MYNYHTSLANSLRSVQEAKAWFASSGISTEGSRLEKIEQSLSRFNDQLAMVRSAEDFRALCKDWPVNTFYILNEAAGFERITRAMKELPQDHLPKKDLRKTLQGPLLPIREVPGDDSVNARNHLAELELAASLLDKDVQLDGFDDVQFTYRGRSFRVEVKRPQSAGSVRRNIEKAFSQLSTKMLDPLALGVVAVSAEKILGLENRILRIAPGATLAGAVEKCKSNFVAEHSGAWDEEVDARICAVVLILRIIWFSESEQQPNLNAAYRTTAIPIGDEGAPDFFERCSILKEIFH